jgi:RNA polymerase sigma factor (sigma-70 family)
MADREPAPCPNGAKALPPLDEAAFIRAWDGDVKRAARAAANGDTDEDDLAQQSRLRLLVANRALPNVPKAYHRALIANTLRSALRREERSFSARSPMAQELSEDFAAPAENSGDVPTAVVAAWTTRLPERLRNVYRHLYAEERSQRETAQLMRVSQPRVAQLNRQLLECGRDELAHLAA